MSGVANNLRCRKLLPSIVLVALGIVCYANSFRNGFVWDDNFQILQNRMLRSWAFLPRFFSTDMAEAYEPSGTSFPVYRPLFMMSLLVDYQTWGPRALGFHLANVVWHVVTGLLMYGLLGALGAGPPWRLLAAALFVCHPLHTENVTFIAGRNGEMSICLMLASLLLFLRFESADASQTKRRWWLLVASCLAFGLALFSKEIAVTFPAIIVAVCLLVPPRVSLSQRDWFLVIGAYAGMLAGYLLARTASLTRMGYPAEFSARERCLLALRSLAQTIQLFLIPLNLHHERSLPTTGWQAAAWAAGGAALLIALVMLGVWSWRRDRRITFGLVFFAVAFSLTSNLVPLNTTFGERWISWPMVGLLIAITAGVEFAASAAPSLNKVGLLFGWVVVGVFSVLTIDQNRVWRDDETFYQTVIARGGDSVRMRSNLAFAYLADQEFSRARAEFEGILESDPNYPSALRGMGRLLATQHQYIQAEHWFERALAIDPGDVQSSIWLAYAQEQLGNLRAAEQTLQAATARTTISTASLILADFYRRHDRLDEAGRVLHNVLQADPMNAAAHNSLGTVLFKKGDVAGAEEQFHLALRYDRWMVDAHANLAAVAGARNDWADALGQYQDALALSPSNADLYYAMGVMLTRSGDTSAGSRALGHAVELDPELEQAVQKFRGQSK